MTAISSNGTGGGLVSAATTWTGGVVPTIADDVTIVVGDTVTIDGTFDCLSLVVNGTLTKSRTIDCIFNLSTTAIFNSGGALDFGTVASPTGSNMVINCLNTANAVYIIQFKNGSEASIYDDLPRTVFTNLTADTLLGSSIITVSDATNWAVGDTLVFEDDTAIDVSTTIFSTAIQSISGLQVTITTPAPQVLDGTVHPLFVVNTSQKTTISCTQHTGNHGVIEVSVGTNSINPARFRGVSFVDFKDRWAPAVYMGSVIGDAWIENCCFFNCIRGFGGLWGSGRTILQNVAFVGTAPKSSAIDIGSLFMFDAHDIVFMNMSNMLRPTSGGSAVTPSFSNLNSINCGPNGAGFNLANQPSFDIYGGINRHITTLFRTGAGGVYRMYGCQITSTLQIASALDFGGVELHNCVFSNFDLEKIGGSTNDIFYTLLTDINNNPKDHLYQKRDGYFRRDPVITTTTTPVASIMVVLKDPPVGAPLKYVTQKSILTGQTITVSVDFRLDPTYTNAVLPTLRVFGAEFNVAQSPSGAFNVFETVTVTTPAAILAHQVQISVEFMGVTLVWPYTNRAKAWFDNLVISGQIHDIGQSLFTGGTEVSNVIDITDTMKHLTLTGIQLGSEVRLYTANGAELPISVAANHESVATSVVDFAYDSTLVDTMNPTTVVVMHLQYEWMSFTTTLGNSSSIPIQQRFDRNYSNPV